MFYLLEPLKQLMLKAVKNLQQLSENPGKIRKIPIGISSCNQPFAEDRRKGCRETWIPELDRKFFSVFIVGGYTGKGNYKLTGDILYCKCHDTYATVPQKNRIFWEWASDNFEFDYLFKTDDDSYVNASLFNNYSPENYDLVGYVFPAGVYQNQHPYCSGGGYFISKRVVEIIKVKLTNLEGAEEVLVGFYAHENLPDIKIRHEPAIEPNSFLDLTPKTLVGHWLKNSVAMKTAHDIVKGVRKFDKVYEIDLVYKIRCQYVKLTIFSSYYTNDGCASLRYIEFIADGKIVDNQLGSVIACSSQSAENPAHNCLVDDPSSWHTQWRESSPAHPHYITFALSREINLEGMRLHRRTGNIKGVIRDCLIETSKEGRLWVKRKRIDFFAVEYSQN